MSAAKLGNFIGPTSRSCCEPVTYYLTVRLGSLDRKLNGQFNERNPVTTTLLSCQQRQSKGAVLNHPPRRAKWQNTDPIATNKYSMESPKEVGGVKLKTLFPRMEKFQPQKSTSWPSKLGLKVEKWGTLVKRRIEPEFRKHAGMTFDQLEKIRLLKLVARDLVQYWLGTGGSGCFRVHLT